MPNNRQFDPQRRHAVKHALLAALGLGAAGVAGISGITSPGPNSSAFTGAYVQKSPRAKQTIQTIGSAPPNPSPFPPLALKAEHNNQQLVTFIPNNTDTPQGFVLFLDGLMIADFGRYELDGPLGSFDFALYLHPGGQPPPYGPSPSLQLGSSGLGNFWFPGDFIDFQTTTFRQPRIETETWLNPAGLAGQLWIQSSPDNHLNYNDWTPVTPVLRTVMTKVLDLGSGQVAVGVPTGTQGTTQLYADGGHRHPFTGRFVDSATYPLALLAGGVFPNNIARIKLNTNWTLRRIWVYTNTGPTGGTETYGIVNAAGVLQGTGVVLPAGPGVSQAESALQVTNLTGGTLYYFAQTAATSVAGPASTNVEVGIEYTMNA